MVSPATSDQQGPTSGENDSGFSPPSLFHGRIRRSSLPSIATNQSEVRYHWRRLPSPFSKIHADPYDGDRPSVGSHHRRKRAAGPWMALIVPASRSETYSRCVSNRLAIERAACRGEDNLAPVRSPGQIRERIGQGACMQSAPSDHLRTNHRQTRMRTSLVSGFNRDAQRKDWGHQIGCESRPISANHHQHRNAPIASPRRNMLQIMKHPGRGSHSDGAANRPEVAKSCAGTEHGQQR